jgi:hypothetical protein
MIIIGSKVDVRGASAVYVVDDMNTPREKPGVDDRRATPLVPTFIVLKAQRCQSTVKKGDRQRASSGRSGGPNVMRCSTPETGSFGLVLSLLIYLNSII